MYLVTSKSVHFDRYNSLKENVLLWIVEMQNGFLKNLRAGISELT